jgi:hypothetical protein
MSSVQWHLSRLYKLYAICIKASEIKPTFAYKIMDVSDFQKCQCYVGRHSPEVKEIFPELLLRRSI